MKALPARHVYHLADAENWPSIQHRGLLSATRLLELSGLSADEQACIEKTQRPASLTLPGGAVLRDQAPMPPSALARCLVDMTPAEWYALINSKVFFWFDIERLNRQRRASGISSEAVVMTIDAGRLLAAYGGRAYLSAINTGNARRRPAVRGHESFVPYAIWLASRWASEAAALGLRPRPGSHRPVELTISDGLPDVMEFVVSLRHLSRDEPFEV
jgi:hypothetical protein